MPIVTDLKGKGIEIRRSEYFYRGYSETETGIVVSSKKEECQHLIYELEVICAGEKYGRIIPPGSQRIFITKNSEYEGCDLSDEEKKELADAGKIYSFYSKDLYAEYYHFNEDPELACVYQYGYSSASRKYLVEVMKEIGLKRYDSDFTPLKFPVIREEDDGTEVGQLDADTWIAQRVYGNEDGVFAEQIFFDHEPTTREVQSAVAIARFMEFPKEVFRCKRCKALKNWLSIPGDIVEKRFCMSRNYCGCTEKLEYPAFSEELLCKSEEILKQKQENGGKMQAEEIPLELIRTYFALQERRKELLQSELVGPDYWAVVQELNKYQNLKERRFLSGEPLKVIPAFNWLYYEKNEMLICAQTTLPDGKVISVSEKFDHHDKEGRKIFNKLLSAVKEYTGPGYDGKKLAVCPWQHGKDSVLDAYGEAYSLSQALWHITNKYVTIDDMMEIAETIACYFSFMEQAYLFEDWTDKFGLSAESEGTSDDIADFYETFICLCDGIGAGDTVAGVLREKAAKGEWPDGWVME